MPTVSVKGDMKQILKDLPRVRRKIVPKIASQSLNKVAGAQTGRAIKAAAGELTGIPQKLLRKRVSQRPASERLMIVKRKVGVAPIVASELGQPRQTKRGVTVKRFRFPGAFLAKGSKGGDQAFKRSGDSRLPIAVQRVGIRSSMENAFTEHFVNASGRLFLDEFTRRLKVELRKPARRR